MQIPMDFLNKHGLNDLQPTSNVTPNNMPNANMSNFTNQVADGMQQ